MKVGVFAPETFRFWPEVIDNTFDAIVLFGAKGTAEFGIPILPDIPDDVEYVVAFDSSLFTIEEKVAVHCLNRNIPYEIVMLASDWIDNYEWNKLTEKGACTGISVRKVGLNEEKVS